MIKESTLFNSNRLGIELYYKLELGSDPEEVFDIPEELVEDIEQLQHDGGKIAKFYKALLYQFGEDEFSHLIDARIHFLWKSKGGKNGGKLILGKCKKPTGELKFYADADYCIVFSADHCFAHNLKNWQILALLYHELKHTCLDKHGNFSTKGHDFEGFENELKYFGAWKSDAERIVRAAQELPLLEGIN
jgi:hypothetical protein